MQSLGQIWRGTQTFIWLLGYFHSMDLRDSGGRASTISWSQSDKTVFESVEFSSSHTNSLYLE